MNIPNLPDNFYKILAALGLLIIGYCFFEVQKSDLIFDNHIRELKAARDSAAVKKFTFANKKSQLLRKADRLAKQYNIPNPIVAKDTTYALSYTYSTSNSKQLDNDVSELYENIIEVNLEERLQMVIYDIKIDEASSAADNNNDDSIVFFIFGFIGFVLLVFGLSYLSWQQKINDTLLLNQVEDKTKPYNYCQSCGKLFSAVRAHGKNKTGELNLAFCNECFTDGSYSEPNLTFEEFLKRVQPDLNKQSKSDKKALLKRFNDLERWKTDEY